MTSPPPLIVPPLRLPLSLRRRPEPATAGAFLLPVGDAGGALALLAGPAGEDAQVFEVAGGLLVVAGGAGGGRASSMAMATAVPGAIRLRKVGAALFLPVDADLSPALLPDEVDGLTRGRGLVVLPGGTVLRFDPDRPVPASALLAADRREAAGWEAPPPGPARADRLVEVMIERPEDDGPDAGLGASGDDLGIGTEEPTPEDTGTPRRLVGGAAMGMGRGMMWLGQKLGLRGLAGLGASWVGSALTMAPKLGQALLGQQEGALRDLLREFREGDIDRALRRAPPLGRGNERGAAAAGSADLPDRDPTYSLPDILGPTGGGRAGYWLGGMDVQQELIREYHKAAQAAARRGDHRRAAFIYARLLEDYRLAANALLQGGLARDAALIFLEKLDDPAAAARAFEAAGELDRALELYRTVGDFEHAGDLYSRLGEHDRALDAYREAADRIVDRERDHLKAGELIRSRAGRPDLAEGYFRDGWAARPGPNAVGCGVELARSLAASGEVAPLLALVAEADALFAPPGKDGDASRFYNELARLADRPELAPARDALRDRALLGLAGKLRQRSGPAAAPGLASTLLGPAQNWSAELIRDAEYALRAASRPKSGDGEPGRSPAAAMPEVTASRVVDGPVTAIAVAAAAPAAFLGTVGGDVVQLDLATGTSTRLGRYALPVGSLAASPSGRTLAVLWHDAESGRTVLAAYTRRPDGTYHMTEGRAETARSGATRPFLSPPIADGGDAFALWDGRRYTVLRGPSLTPWAEVPRGDDDATAPDLGPSGGPAFDDEVDFDAIGPDDGGRPGGVPILPTAALVLPGGPEGTPTVLELGPAGSWACLAPEIGPVGRLPIPWAPRPPADAGGSAPSVSIARRGPTLLELAGIGADGTLCLSWLATRGDRVEPIRFASPPSGKPYRAAAVIRGDLIAGVGLGAVHWLRPRGRRLDRLSTTRTSARPALAAAPCPQAGVLVLLSADGWAERVPLPNAH